jgi:hypothetical protein
MQRRLCAKVENELVITFASAALYARAMRDQIRRSAHTYPDFERFNFIRKMACNFGWDWGPTLITAGIGSQSLWRCGTPRAIESVRPLVTQANAQTASVEFVDWSGAASKSSACRTHFAAGKNTGSAHLGDGFGYGVRAAL